jgi:hypothetical protein
MMLARCCAGAGHIMVVGHSVPEDASEAPVEFGRTV